MVYKMHRYLSFNRRQDTVRFIDGEYIWELHEDFEDTLVVCVILCFAVSTSVGLCPNGEFER